MALDDGENSPGDHSGEEREDSDASVECSGEESEGSGSEEKKERKSRKKKRVSKQPEPEEDADPYELVGYEDTEGQDRDELAGFREEDVRALEEFSFEQRDDLAPPEPSFSRVIREKVEKEVGRVSTPETDRGESRPTSPFPGKKEGAGTGGPKEKEGKEGEPKEGKSSPQSDRPPTRERNIGKVKQILSQSEGATGLGNGNAKFKRGNNPGRPDPTEYEVQETDDLEPTQALLDKIRDSPKLDKEHVDFSHHQLKDVGVMALIEVFQDSKCASITGLELTDNFITPRSAIPLLQTVKADQRITHLDLSNNMIGLKSAHLVGKGAGPAFYSLLKGNNILRELHLCRNKIGDADMKYIAEAMVENVHLHTLNLWGNDLTATSGTYVQQILQENGDLAVLNVGWNKLSNEGTRLSLEGLLNNNVLKSINLSWNGITDKGGQSIGGVLHSSTSLEEIDISHNRIAGDGAKMIADAITQNQVIKKLDLSHNPLGDQGVKSIIIALRDNSSMEIINMQSCHSGEKANEEVGETIKKRRNNLQLLFSFSSLPAPDFGADKIEFSVGAGPGEGQPEEPANEK